MNLAFEILSHRFGEPRLNSKPEIKNEIEEVFLRPRMDITLLNRDQFVELSIADFMARGWETPSPVRGLNGKPSPLMDLRKDGVGLQIGFASSALLNDLLKLQTAHDLRLHPIDVGGVCRCHHSTLELPPQGDRKTTDRHDVQRSLPKAAEHRQDAERAPLPDRAACFGN